MHLYKPYNSYNLYFTLERTLLVEARKGLADASASVESRPPSSPTPPPKPPTLTPTGYESIDLPPLPPRYQHLKSILPANWYVPGKNKLVKRKHSKTHGVATFKEVATAVATNWKQVDPVTKEYVETIVVILRERYSEIISTLDEEGGQETKKKTKTKRHAKPSAQQQHFECQRATTPPEKMLPSRGQVVNTTRSSTQSRKLDTEYLTLEQDNQINRHQRNNFTFGLCQEVDEGVVETGNHHVVPGSVPDNLVGGGGLRDTWDDRHQRNNFKFGLCQDVGMNDWGIHNFQCFMSEQVASRDLHLQQRHAFRPGVWREQEVDTSDWEIINSFLSA